MGTTTTPEGAAREQPGQPDGSREQVAQGAGPYVVHGDRNLPAEQQTKFDELRRWLKEREEAAARMTPEEVAQAETEWETFKKSMNDERRRAGARLLYPE